MTNKQIKPRVLYVDDEEENLLVFKSSFRRIYEVETASSGEEAREMLKDHHFEVVISDQRMPHLNGVELLNSMPEQPECVRIILTGYTDIQTVIEALNHGKIHKYVSKPWDKFELKTIIDAELEALYRRTISASASSGGATTGTAATGSQQDQKVVAELEKKLERSYNYLLQLSEIGQEIIENRNIKSIIEKTYGAINGLLSAPIFACGLHNEEENVLDYTIMEEGEWLSGKIDLKDKEKAGVWTFTNKKEIFSNEWVKDAETYLGQAPTVVAGKTADSLIYLPLMEHDKAIGVLTVQSFTQNAYDQQALNIMKNMAIFVATALQNAKAYQQIEVQKEEIEKKNAELEEKVKERTQQLQQTYDEVQKQKSEVENMYSKVKLLGEIGQQITSTLSLDKIIERVYNNVNDLMDATVFGIGVYNESTNELVFPGAIEKGVKLPTWKASLDEIDRIPVWCFTHEKEVIINDFELEYNKYIKSIPKPKTGDNSHSMLYLPILAGDQKVGVITVQSFRKHSYNQYHLDILRSLKSYIAIAILNARSYERMTEAFEKLKSAQTQLVEAEKMASLGVLTAGVAHEINNPVNFISGGIASLKENYHDVETLLQMFLSFSPMAKDADKKWGAIQSYIREIELDSLLPEMQDLFTSISNGAVRSMEIVKGLKNFSRLDEHDMKRASLEEGLDSTLVILNNQFKNRITIEKDYAGLKDLLCFPGQLNQVFMNILNNAVQAIEGEGVIRITTKEQNGQQVITIQDSGPGMPEDIKDHIFEPFYTTKGVGQGTGLGLSISYGIINKHEGTIEVESEIGKGTTFTITLPSATK